MPTRAETQVLVLLIESEALSKTNRNPYADPLNRSQIELLRQIRSNEETADTPPDSELTNLVRLTIQGIAAGLRTTG